MAARGRGEEHTTQRPVQFEIALGTPSGACGRDTLKLPGRSGQLDASVVTEHTLAPQRPVLPLVKHDDRDRSDVDGARG